MSDARRYAVWPEPRSRSLKGSRPSVPHRTNFYCYYNLHDLFQPCILCVAEDSFIKLGTFHMNTLINFSTTGKEVPIKLATVVQLIVSRMFNKLGT